MCQELFNISKRMTGTLLSDEPDEEHRSTDGFPLSQYDGPKPVLFDDKGNETCMINVPESYLREDAGAVQPVIHAMIATSCGCGTRQYLRKE